GRASGVSYDSNRSLVTQKRQPRGGPTVSTRLPGCGSAARERDVDVVLDVPATDGEQHAARAAYLDHLLAQVTERPERRAAEAEEPVAANDADVRRRARRPDATDDEPVRVLAHLDAEELPGELVGAGAREGGRPQLDVLVAPVAAERERDPVALGMV